MRSSDVRAFALASACALVAGCFGPLDLSNRRCPCDQGWTCDTASNRCVQLGVDAAHLDGGVSEDAARLDAPTIDTGVVPIDTGMPIDAWVAPVDAASVDAAFEPTDGGTDWCPSAARVCDDFESASTTRQPPFDWSSATAVRSTARAFHGAASGLFQSSGPGDQPEVGIDFTTPPSEIWSRFWIYVDSANVINESAIWFAGEGVAPYGSTSLLINDAGLAVYTSGGTGTYLGGVPIPRDRWACISMHLNVGTAGHIEVSLDGSPAVAGDADTSLPAGVNTMGLGITFVGSGQSTPLAYAFDDFAATIDGTPLPCL